MFGQAGLPPSDQPPKTLIIKPAATAEPMTPATLGPMACISRKLEGFSFWPTVWDTRAAMGTADTTGGADEGIHLAAGGKVHDVAEDDAAGRGQAEGEQAQEDDLQGIRSQEGVIGGLEAHGQAQRDGDDVHQGVLSGVGQAVAHAALTEQVAQHEHADEGGGVGHQQDDEDGDQNGEHDLLSFGDRTELGHFDLAHLLGGEQLHNGRLDQGDQRHIRVCRDGDGRQQVHSQLGRGEDGGGAVRAADNADGGGLSRGEAQHQGQDKGGEDAQLSSSAQQQGHGVGQQGTEVGHGADAHKDNGRVDGVLDALIDDPHKPYASGMGGRVHHRLCKQTGEGQVGQQHTKRDGDQQQGLKALADAKIQQNTGDHDHHQLPPIRWDRGETGASQDRTHYLGKKLHSILLFITRPVKPSERAAGNDGCTHRKAAVFQLESGRFHSAVRGGRSSASSYPRVTSRSSVLTVAPVETAMALTVPSTGADTSISIFIASRMTSTSPAFTA